MEMSSWQLSRKRRLAPSAGGERRTLKRLRKRSFLRGGQVAELDKFAEVLGAYGEDIAFLFASHWRYPMLAPYIAWFYAQARTDTPTALSRIAQNSAPPIIYCNFSSIFDPNVLHVTETNKECFNDFFDNMFYELIEARYYNDLLEMGMDWTTTRCAVRLCTPKRNYILRPGQVQKFDVDWKDMPEATFITFEQGNWYSSVRVNSINRLFKVDWSYVIELTGVAGHSHQIIERRGLGPVDKLQIEGTAYAKIRVTWKGPNEAFQRKYFHLGKAELINKMLADYKDDVAMEQALAEYLEMSDIKNFPTVASELNERAKRLRGANQSPLKDTKKKTVAEELVPFALSLGDSPKKIGEAKYEAPIQKSAIPPSKRSPPEEQKHLKLLPKGFLEKKEKMQPGPSCRPSVPPPLPPLPAAPQEFETKYWSAEGKHLRVDPAEPLSGESAGPSRRRKNEPVFSYPGKGDEYQWELEMYKTTES